MLLRSYHDAVAGFRPTNNTWALASQSPATGEIICHGDFGPWNIIWQDEEPVGIVDWDFASPARPIYDVAYALEYVAPFRDDEECVEWLAYPEAPDRKKRIKIFTEAYGLTGTDNLVDAVIAVQQTGIENVRRLAV